MATLYELAERYRNLEVLLDDPEVDNIILMDALGEVEDEFNEKIKNIVLMVKNLEANKNAIKLEEKRLHDRRQVIERKINNLKAYMDCNMKLKGIKKVDADLFTVTLRKNAPKLEITDEDIIPTCYLVEEVIKKLDKESIKAELKGGDTIPGARLVASESILIR